MMTTILRMLFFRGRRFSGELSGIRFPVRLSDLTASRRGPALLTAMLQYGGHLPEGVRVRAIRDEAADIRDGVKGDKGVITVEYDTSAAKVGGLPLPPSRLFLKFNVGKLGAMRLLVETSECAECECLFYRHLAGRLPSPVRVPTCFFADYSKLSGDFVLVSEAVRFGEGDVAPLKHRVRDDANLDEQKAFAVHGGTLNATYWAQPMATNSVEQAAAVGGGGPASSPINPCGAASLPRFEKTHRRLWIVAQTIAKLAGLKHTARRTLKGRAGVNDKFMTWSPPPELIGREAELIRDMPAILASLCDVSKGMVAYGHNDMTTDNVYFFTDPPRSGDSLVNLLAGSPETAPEKRFGLFDWQQACYNNVGQEWAWNWHWLEPEFLEKHEDALIETLLATYAKHGRVISKAQFLNSYVLGTAQMYVWGGGGLQLLMSGLEKQGLFAGLLPNDPRTKGGGAKLDKALQEKLTGAEMTRRTFTNVCAIMRRHDFVGAWDRWQQEHEIGRYKQQPAVGVAGSLVAWLLRFAAAWWFPIVAAAGTAINMFTIIFTGATVVVFLAAILGQPKRWASTAIANAAGATLGTAILLALCREQGIEYLNTTFPLVLASPAWAKATGLMTTYGVGGMLLVSSMPIILHPVIVFGILSGLSNSAILSIVFAGRTVKYLVMSYIACNAPGALRFFGIKTQLVEYATNATKAA